MVFSTSNEAELSNGLVFCEVRSRLTGNRLYVAFFDHCQPLAVGNDLKAILQFLHDHRSADGRKYTELRPISDKCMFEYQPDFGVWEAFSFHTIDLRPDLE